MTVRFRNVDADPSQPVEAWPAEAILTAFERGGLSEWRRIAEAIRDDPWGGVAEQVAEAVAHARPYGVAEVMEDVIAGATPTRMRPTGRASRQRSASWSAGRA